MDAEQLYATMKQDTSKVWYTLEDISEITNEDVFNIEKVLNKSDLFVRSSMLSKNGEQLYTTKNDFKKNASFAQKIIGAFKNRID
ncbi:hypothetical protein OCK74_12095 [Chitinophagaceae bacterium LB-8]|uniref:Uncharacterized protein n=1 Tax=Paraflavisolibacter caeni TaxID=2982496 RepID=A0A9X3BIB9_9BACT|nr:hypothetical protein [Paraflavisolibacter caeni]MCU7549863.1 hypothetical protein [Paraflavisolibacter caeni]